VFHGRVVLDGEVYPPGLVVAAHGRVVADALVLAPGR
jgi:hypothetical protein